MSVRYGFIIEIYRFMHSLHTSLAHAAHDTIVVKVEDSKIKDDARTTPEIRKMANYSTKGRKTTG